MFGGEDVVLSVNDVQTQRAELFYLHCLPSVFPWLEKVPEEETAQNIIRSDQTDLIIDWILMVLEPAALYFRFTLAALIDLIPSICFQ